VETDAIGGLESLQQELAIVVNEKQKIAAELDHLKAEHAGEVVFRESERQKMAAELEQLKAARDAQVAVQESEKRRMTAELEQLKAERHLDSGSQLVLQKNLKAAKDRSGRLEHELDSLNCLTQERDEELQQALEERELALANFQMEFEKLTSERDLAEAAELQLRRMLEGKEKTIDRLEKEKEDMEKANDQSLRHGLSQANGDVELAPPGSDDSELKQAKEHIDRLTQDLQEAAKVEHTLREALDEENSEVGRLMQMLGSLSAQVREEDQEGEERDNIASANSAQDPAQSMLTVGPRWSDTDAMQSELVEVQAERDEFATQIQQLHSVLALRERTELNLRRALEEQKARVVQLKRSTPVKKESKLQLAAWKLML
jgi:hypothetical protein